MRKDIKIHIKTGDVELSPRNQFKLRDFKWIDNPNGLSRYIYGEISIPASVTEASIRSNGCFVNIPYTPRYKEFMIRLKRVYEDGSCCYLTNKNDGSNWFVVKSGIYGGPIENVYASELIKISDMYTYYINIDSGFARLYSSHQSDFPIVDANRQNSNCLLACVPSNNYRYPLTGVGLVRWINAHNVNDTGLADTIQREFTEDGVTPKNAYYNYETKQMTLDLDVNVD